MTSQVEVPPLTGLIHFISGKRRVKVEILYIKPIKDQSQLQQAAIFIFFYFSVKTSLDISCELSARQIIHMEFHDLLSLKKKKKLSSAVVVIGTLMVNMDKSFRVETKGFVVVNMLI